MNMRLFKIDFLTARFFRGFIMAGTVIGIFAHYQLQERAEKVDIYNKINDRMVNVRFLIDIIQQQCEIEKNVSVGQSLNNYILRTRAIYDLSSSANGVRLLFGDDANKKIVDFIAFDRKNKNPCIGNISLHDYDKRQFEATSILQEKIRSF